MKDEEMAEQFADNISGLELTCSLLSAKDKSHAYRLGRYEGFLAGLKAGRQNDQLTKAKEIIKILKDDLSIYSGSYQKIIAEAEQFLKEIEK